MSRRIYLAIAIAVALASVAGATYMAVQKTAAQRAKTTAQRGAPGGANANRRRPTAQRTANQSAAPIRPADPNRAPQSAVDQALYTDEEFFGVIASVMRPYSQALDRVAALAGQYPKDARLHLHAARLAERLGQFDKAAAEMTEYASLKGRSADALRRLASFYHNRARYTDEVRTLQELAKSLPVTERSLVYRQAADLVRSRSLKEFRPADFFAELVAADPANVQPVKDYVEQLQLARQHKEALAVMASFQAKFPGELAYFLKTRAMILEETGDRRAAEEVYSTSFDPNWPQAVASDYYDLLRRFGRYRVVRRGLQDRVRQGAADLETAGRLFSIFAYEGNYEQASRLLKDLEQRRAGQKDAGRTSATAPTGAAEPQPVRAQWTARELETAAEMFSRIGYYDQASRYLYTLYLTGGLEPGTQVREEALYRLFKVMVDAAGTPTRVAAGDLSFYKDVAEVDQHPGFMNGVLSLILSGEDVSEQFQAQEETAAGYFNRAFAYRIFTSFKQEYASSARLGEMYLGVVNVFSGLGEHRLAIDAGREFQQRYPDSPSYASVSLRIADSYVALKDRAGERAVLRDLLDRLARQNPKGKPLVAVSPRRWGYGITPRVELLIDKIKYNIEAYSDTYDPTADEGGQDADAEEDSFDSGGSGYDQRQGVEGPTYSSVLERYVASLAAEEKKNETVAFFWSEIKKYPREEGIYERFLRWLGQAELLNEQLKAYNSAIRQFDSNTWYHRMARWYVRQKRGRELARYSRQLIDVFDEEEITDFLYRFAGYGTTATGDELNWDERLAFELYGYAQKRFPRNVFFVRGMLTYLEKTDRARWERLSAEYYFADRSIREPYLAWLSKQGRLRDRYQKAKSQKSSEPSRLAPYDIFAADAGMWLSHHDEALDAYRRLVALYPGEPQYADRFADLARSLGQQSEKLYEESAGALAAMAEIYPAEHAYRIKAGEVYAELGDFKRAADQWNYLTRLEPGDRETYLEVATVFWDYYQFDDAIRVFKQLRDVTGDQTIYAYRLGAVYEGKGDMESAIAEYVKVLPEPGDGRDTVAKRLAQLSRRTGLADKIGKAYQSARAARPDDWQLVIGYAVYESERERAGEALALLRAEVDRSTNVAFLESVRDLFRSILRPEDELQVVTRLAGVARDEREAMMYRLQLAALLERRGQADRALGIIDKLVADYPTNVGVVEESVKFYWRAGKLDRSLDLYRRTLARARGPNRRSLTLQFARRQIEAGKLKEAEATLRAFYDENRLDTEVFSELARTLGAENKMDELVQLYQSAFKEMREAGLSSEEAKARAADLRVGMISTLASLGKHAEALDQHIEIINVFPEDANRLASAIGYAEQHNLMPRLTDYYERLTKQSYKNFRWQLVLGRIYERLGNLDGAVEQYRAAVVNEPQRPDLRFSLASVMARRGRFDDAIATLRQGWTLAGRDPQWLVEVARIQVQQGRRDEAVQTLRQALAEKKNKTVDDQLRIAMLMSEWGLHGEAVVVFEQAFAGLQKVLKDQYVSAYGFSSYVRAMVRTESVTSAFQKVERLRGQFNAIAENSQDTDGYRARNIVSALDDSMRSDFGKGVIDYANAAEMSTLAAAIRGAISKLTIYSDREQLIRYLGIARGANLVEVEEQIHIQLKEAAFKVRTKPTDSEYYNELRALVSFYERHAAFGRAAEALTAEFARDPYKDRFDYQSQIAAQYRLSGDGARELQALRTAYSSSSGDLTTDTVEWVERYLSLLHSSGNRSELTRLSSTYNPHQLQLINFLIDKNEKSLALRALEMANQSPAWVASRSGEVGLFLKDTSIEPELFFKKALEIKPIGEMLGRKFDPARSLVGEDWFLAARNYGYWLGLVGREAESRNMVAGEIESKPGSAEAQLELAAYYLDRKDLARAGEHTQLAAELAPGDKHVAVVRGAVALARGDRKGAIDAWATLISGRVTVEEAETYLKVTADNGVLREALPRLEEFVVSYVNRFSRDNQDEERMEAIKPLVREMARRASADPQLASTAAASLHTAITRMTGDLVIGRMLVEERLLPDAALASIYRTIHKRLSDMTAAVFGTPAYENGYWNGTEYIQPARELRDWRRLFVDYLIRSGSLDEARLLISTIKQEQADLRLALADSDGHTGDHDRYDWVPLASALIELRAGRDAAKAVAELRRYCGLDAEASDQGVSTGLHEQCLKAYALLVAERREVEAEALLYDAYTKAARSRYTDDASLAGLAEIEARRGRGDEAGRLLKLMVERSTDNLKALRLAAETAARAGRYNEAVEFREQIARANPTDSTNKLELARAIAAGGRGSDAIERVAALIAERATPNSVRAQAAEVAGEIVRRDVSLAARAASLFEQRGAGDQGSQLARAAVAEAVGQAEEARSALGRVSGGPLAAVAHMKLGLIALAAGRDREAVTSFERAAYLDADGALTEQIAFRAAGPRAQLIRLYSRTGREQAAIRLAEGIDQQQSQIGAALRQALSAEGEQKALASGVAFEPSLETARARVSNLRSIAELNEAAGPGIQNDVLEALAQAATGLGQYDRAIAIERLRATQSSSADRPAIEKRLAEIVAAAERQRLAAALRLRVDRSNTTESIYGARIGSRI